MGKKKPALPLSDLMQWGRINKRPTAQRFENGEYGNESDHTEDLPGVVFFSQYQLRIVAGLLYYIARRYPMNAEFIKFEEAQAVYDAALQIMSLPQISFDGQVIDGDWDLSIEPSTEPDAAKGKFDAKLHRPGDLVSFGSLRFRVKPVDGISYLTDNYILQMKKDATSEWVDTDYNLGGMSKFHTVLSAVTDLAGTAIGASAWGVTPNVGTDGVRTETVTLRLDTSGLTGEPGEDGTVISEVGITALDPDADATAELVDSTAYPGTKKLNLGIPRGHDGADGADGHDGDTGLDGKSISFDDPPSIEVDPNQPAEIVITGDTDTEQTVQAHLPRARTFTVGDVTPIEAGGTPTVEFHEVSETGDILVDFGLVTGATGESGAGTDTISETAPAFGTTAHYRYRVKDRFFLPFVVPDTCIMKNFVTQGLFAVETNLFPECRRPATGIPGDSFPEPGDIQMFFDDGTGVNGDGAYTFPTDGKINPFAGSVSVVGNRRVLFVPFDNSLFTEGVLSGFSVHGEVILSFDIEYPDPDAWDLIGTHDLTPDVNDWHVTTVPSDRPTGITGGTHTNTDGGGFHPTAVAGDVMHCSISPRRSGHWHVTTIEVFWKNHTTSDDFTLFVWTQDNSDHTWNYHAVSFPTGSSGSTVLTLNQDIEYLSVSSHCYPHDPADWQIYQLVISGSDL